MLPGDKETKCELERQCESLYNRHNHSCLYHTKKYFYTFPAPPRHLFVSKGSANRWLNRCVLLILSMILLGWPYRIIMRCITGHVHQVMTKYVYIGEVGAQARGPTSSVNNMDHVQIVPEIHTANERTPLLNNSYTAYIS